MFDIGLPTLNGIKAARRIRDASPVSKIFFVSENRSCDILDAALNTGANGYVVKSYAASDLLPAMKTVLQGKQFVGAGLTSDGCGVPMNDRVPAITHCHEVGFYPDDASLLVGYARFIQSALEGGSPVIVVVIETHRVGLLSTLEANGVNVPAAVEQGSYIPVDAADALSRLMVDDMPDPVLCAKVIDDLVVGAAKVAQVEHRRVSVCGEIAPTLLSKGNAEGAIKLEDLWDEITRGYGVHTLCGYLSSAFPNGENSPIFKRICAEHSAVYSH